MENGRVRVLCVDDEPHLLEALIANLRKTYDVTQATSGPQGLEIVRREPPFAVVLSDLAMPQMDGAEFLRKVREISPDTVRMLLTGQRELESALAAVNEGQIFRFLTKPCRPNVLLDAFERAVEQYRLITAEKVLLEKTLHGSINALTDLLAAANPLAFGKACRIKRHVHALLLHLEIKETWQIEVAAMLSQLGSLSLPPESIEKLYYGLPLTADEQVMVDRLPQIAEQLLANIPRLDAVKAIIARQHLRFDQSNATAAKFPAVVQLGASILHIVHDYDLLEAQGFPPEHAMRALCERAGCYDPRLLDVFQQVLPSEAMPLAEVTIAALQPAMVFADDVRTSAGTLLFARGQEVTPNVCGRLANFPPKYVQEPLKVYSRALETKSTAAQASRS